MTVSPTLLAIVITVLLAVVAYLAWRLWQVQRAAGSRQSDSAAPDASPPASEAQGTTLPRRSATRPPAWAGRSPHDLATNGPPDAARPRGVRPAAASGKSAAPARGPGSDNPTLPPRRSKPPPALAGDLPVATPTSTASPSRPRSSGGSGARPPAAAAGGPRRDDDTSDPEPAQSRRRRDTGEDISPQHALARVTSWGYQLQNLKLGEAQQSAFDLLVTDYSQDGTDEEAFTAKDVGRLKLRRGGAPRLVYAYLSVGEAENYRYYWQRSWVKSPPAWLIGENREWRGNYLVRFWDRAWQAIILGREDSYIDRIAAAGFDGIYLDRCDVYEEIAERHAKVAREREDVEADMVDFIATISGHVRTHYPHMGLIMQNAELLLTHAAVRDAIDAVAKEELLFGLEKAETRNPAEDVLESRGMLERTRRDGKAVLVVEYLDRSELRLEATGALRALGYVPYMAAKSRELDTLETDQPVPAVA